MPAFRSGVRSWLPSHYIVDDDNERESIYRNGDSYTAVLVSYSYFHNNSSRQEFADTFRDTIRRFENVGWGTYEFTDIQYENLRNPVVDFETSWRNIHPRTVCSFGV